MVNEIARFATVTAGGKRRWGLVRDNGFADLSVRHSEYASLKEVIEANGLQRLADAGAGLPLDFAIRAVTASVM